MLNSRVPGNDLIADIGTRRDDAIASLVVGFGAIPTDQPQAARDAQVRPLLAAYFAKLEAFDGELTKAVERRSENRYPDPTCGSTLPGR